MEYDFTSDTGTRTSANTRTGKIDFTIHDEIAGDTYSPSGGYTGGHGSSDSYFQTDDVFDPRPAPASAASWDMVKKWGPPVAIAGIVAWLLFG